MLYRKDRGVKRCNLTAVYHFERDTHGKDPFAMKALGQCYMFGAGVEFNPEIGSAYVQSGAPYGDPGEMSIRSWN